MRNSKVLGAVGAVLLLGLTAVPLAAQKPPAMSHTAQGRANCLMCHSGNMPNVPGVPASHAERPNETCLWCHAPDAAIQTAEPPAIPHTLQGRANCMMCHSGAMQAVPGVPDDHEGRDVKYCTMCHTSG
jgi:hypothetical protein